MSILKIKDYKNILHFYKMPLPSSNKMLKMQAEKLLVNNLCRCIKKTDKYNERRAIKICTNSVINSKGFKRGKFTCKKRPSIVLSKNKSIKSIKKMNANIF